MYMGMKKTILLCALALVAGATQIALAQDNAEEEYGWKNSAVVGVNVTQVSLHNWTKGGENSVAFILFSKNNFNRYEEGYEWKNTIKLQYGETKAGEDDFRKNEDEIFLESMYSKKIGWAVNPYGAVQFRTQFAPGYKYTTDETTGEEVRRQISDFMDPGYLQESVGFTYSTGEEFSTRLGVALKQTFSEKYGYAMDPEDPDPDQTFRFQTGIESSTQWKKEIMKNTTLSSSLDLFSAFDKLDVWDVRWETDLTGKVNDILSVSVNVLVIHEIAQTRKTQVKQVLALGFSYALL